MPCKCQHLSIDVNGGVNVYSEEIKVPGQGDFDDPPGSGSMGSRKQGVRSLSGTFSGDDLRRVAGVLIEPKQGKDRSQGERGENRGGDRPSLGEFGDQRNHKGGDSNFEKKIGHF